jgi:predicted secreted protein
MTSAVAGNGVLLQLGDGGTAETFDTIAEVLDIDGPNQTREQIEVTSHSSAGWREYIAGLRDGGEVSFPINSVPTDSTQQALRALIDSGAEANFKIVYPNGYRDTFAAIVTDWGTKSPVDGAVTEEIKLKISGEITRELGT